MLGVPAAVGRWLMHVAGEPRCAAQLSRRFLVGC